MAHESTCVRVPVSVAGWKHDGRPRERERPRTSELRAYRNIAFTRPHEALVVLTGTFFVNETLS